MPCKRKSRKKAHRRSKPHLILVGRRTKVPVPKKTPSAEPFTSKIKSFRRNDKHCDAVFEAGGEKFKIHKSTFAVYSDYFEKPSTVKMQKKDSNVAYIDDTRSDVMKCIVDFIYTGQLSINRENVVELLETADYLRIEKIKKLSEDFLLCNVDAKNCVSVWICARTYNLEELLEKTLRVFGSNLLSVPQEEWDLLFSERFIEIMKQTKKIRNSEESFTATAAWAKSDLDARKNVFCKMFQSFDLSLFSKVFLNNIVKYEPLILISPEVLQKVVVELMARLERASEENRKTSQKLAKLENQQRIISLLCHPLETLD